MNPNYRDVARRAEHRCEYCRAPEVIFNFAFEVEHIVPKSQLGSNELSNLALACRCCNICSRRLCLPQTSQHNPSLYSFIRARTAGTITFL